MNIEMLEIYRSMIDSDDLKQEDADLLKKNLEEEKKQIEEELEKLYDDGGMIKHSKEINTREDIIDELKRMINSVQAILQGENVSDVPKEVFQEDTNFAEDEKDKTEEDEVEEEYDEEIEEETEETYNEEYDEEVAEDSAFIENTIDLNQSPSEEYKAEAIAVIQERRKKIGTIENALQRAEVQARALIQKMQESEKSEVAQDKNLDKTQDYEKDEKVR